MKTGRNDLCPCGSGKKYKKCCMVKTTVVPADDLSYRRMSKIYKDLEEKLETYLFEKFDEQDLGDALFEFFCWPEEAEEYVTEEIMDALQDLYRPWILYNWDCGLALADEADGDDGEKMEITISQAYLKENSHKISEPEKKLITAISCKPYCFWEVTHVNPGESVDLKNIMTETVVTVREYTASKILNIRNIIFARVVVVENISMFVGMGRTVIPYRMKPELIALRKEIKSDNPLITDKDLIEWDVELRETYLDMDHGLHTPPKMQNTDGDPMELHKLVFEIKDPETAFDKLVSLCTVESADTLKKTGQIDKKGRIVKIDFPWTKKGNKKIPHYDNTILGEISIHKKQLIIQVNSAKRAKRIRKEVKKRLGSEALFKLDAIEDMDAVMNRTDTDSSDQKKFQKEQQDLMNSPEIQQRLAEIILKHWDDWMDMKIPALGNKTPRKAVKTADGREAVDALLYDAETQKTPDPLMDGLHRQGIERVRKELGLTLNGVL